MNLSNEYCGCCKSTALKAATIITTQRELYSRRTLVLWSRYHRYIKYCRTLARPNLTPVVFSGGSRVERQVAGTNGEAPDFGRGLLLFWACAGASNQSPSQAQPSPGTVPNPPKSMKYNAFCGFEHFRLHVFKRLPQNFAFRFGQQQGCHPVLFNQLHTLNPRHEVTLGPSVGGNPVGALFKLSASPKLGIGKTFEF